MIGDRPNINDIQPDGTYWAAQYTNIIEIAIPNPENIYALRARLCHGISSRSISVTSSATTPPRTIRLETAKTKPVPSALHLMANGVVVQIKITLMYDNGTDMTKLPDETSDVSGRNSLR